MADLKSVIYKLLDKAGKDPRLTPRLLREKAEKSMSLGKGSLTARREEIKGMIVDWYIEDQVNTMKLLAKLAKVSGFAPGIFKGIKELATDGERITTLRERLREKGLVFSDVPTIQEIEKIREEHEKRKDLDGIDSSLVIESGRKRGSAAVSSEAPPVAKEGAEEKVKKFAAQSFASDEEAEAEF